MRHAPDAEALGDAAAGQRLCEACGGELSEAQVARGARSCSAPCRARTSRARRKRATLARLDALMGELAALRVQIEHW